VIKLKPSAQLAYFVMEQTASLVAPLSAPSSPTVMSLGIDTNRRLLSFNSADQIDENFRWYVVDQFMERSS
jgi:hypothetical protein